MTDLNTLDTKTLVAMHNELAIVPLKAWKESKGKLIARIEALQKDATPAAKPAENTRAEVVGAIHAALAKAEPTEAAATSAKTAPVTPKAEGEKKPRKQGVGALCKALIADGKTNQEVLDAVLAKFPDAQTTKASVAWYRAKAKAAV